MGTLNSIPPQSLNSSFAKIKDRLTKERKVSNQDRPKLPLPKASRNKANFLKHVPKKKADKKLYLSNRYNTLTALSDDGNGRKNKNTEKETFALSGITLLNNRPQSMCDLMEEKRTSSS